ncbi:MAG: ABC transporter substrate-binding protein [Clostridium butyricum]|nr:ABC transporter substrate-binding protein [Clostridium butyricum]
MKKKLLSGIAAILMGIMLVGCGGNKSIQENSEKVKVTVSIYPLKEYAEAIAGDKAEITCMVPENIEPHDYDPKSKNLTELAKSDIFVYNGLGMENWIDKVNEITNDSKIIKVDSSAGIEIRTEENAIDPHIWLSIKNAEIQSENIKNALIEADAENKAYYEKNYEKFKSELEELYNEYKPKFDNLTNKNFITGHAAFGYLCRDFGITQRSVENLFGEGEPTPGQLKELVNFCKENNIKTVFSESLASPKVSETLANEVGAEVVPIYTLESKEDDKSYIEAMRYNLEQIYKCSNND